MFKQEFYFSQEFNIFFEQFKHQNVDEIALKLSSKNIPFKKELIQQISGWQKSKDKLPLWHKTKGIIFPPKINLEQCSSEATASYKSKNYKGKIGIDLTGGFGIDSYYLSKKFDEFFYVEPNLSLLNIVQHNFQILGVKNVVYVNKTAEEFILEFNKKADLIYIDPSRRDENNRKLSALKNTQPDVLRLLDTIKNKCDSLVIKASPMLDIKQSIEELKNVCSIKIIAIENECKEIVFELKFNQAIKEASIKAVDIKGELIKEFDFTFSSENNTSVETGKIESYLYEPSSAIIKAGAFKYLTKIYPVKKLHPNTHLYTSNQFIEDFQGRVFKVNTVCPYKKEKVVQYLKNQKANLSTRNFKDNSDAVKKKLGIKDGGNDYLFACTDYQNKPVIIICEKIN
ncbi:MAG: THUMP-like domain-containing protein [Bacteroidia bacterium]